MTKIGWLEFIILILLSNILVRVAMEYLYPDSRYRAALVECGRGHYDTKTGAFVEHGGEGK